MKTVASHAAGVIAALLLLGMSQTAHAQLNNQPFSFQRGSIAAGSPGMSSAYREIILERKLLGRPAANNTFIRGTDGSLINVERKGDQAFGRPVAAPYARSQGGLALASIGYSPDAGSAGLLRAAARPVDSPTEDMPAVFGTAPGAVPINSWIHQLATLPDLAS